MEVIFDGSSGWPVEGDGILGTLFDQVRSEVEARKRVVVSLTLDGAVIPRARQRELEKEPVRRFRLLEIKTADPVRLSQETVALLLPYLTDLDRRHEEGIGMLERGDLAKAVETLSHCFEGWEVFTHAMRDLSSLGSLDFTKLSPGTGSVEARIRKLTSTLSRFGSTLRMKEAERIIDIAEKELRPLIREWKEVLGSIP